MFSKLTPYYQNRLNKSVIIDARVANNAMVKTKGLVKLPILIDRQLFNIAFHVLPGATHPVFLGKPFHKRTRAQVDHSTDMITLTNTADIHSAEGFDIAPFSEVMCYANLGGEVPEGSVGICTQTLSSQDKGLMVANAAALVRENGVPMRLYNFTGRTLKINRGEKIGIFNICQKDDYCVPIDLHGPRPEGKKQTEQMAQINSLTQAEDPYEPNFNFKGTKLNKEQLGKLQRLLKRYYMCFVNPNNKQIGLTNAITCKIETIPGAVPVYKYPYKRPPELQQALEEIIDENIKQGILQEIDHSEWSSPALLVKKPSGEGYRLVCDFRELNKVTIPMVLRVPRIDDVIDTVGTSKPKYFSVLDLTQGFHQIPLDEESRNKASFKSHRRHIRYNRMSMGLRNSSMYFQLLMDTVLKGIQYEYVMSYVDDLILYSRTFEDHMYHIEQVLIRMKDANLKLSPHKCKFAVPKVKFLGHILSEEGIEPNYEKVDEIKAYPTPKNVKAVRGFLGISGYYRRFVDRYAEKARPLYNLTKKDVPFQWDEECEQAFQTIRSELTDNKILAYPDFKKKFTLTTRSSHLGVSAHLTQEHDGVIKPVGFAGRGYSAAELNYPAGDKQMLAVVFGVQYFKIYLASAPFDIHSDCSDLRQALNAKDLKGRQARWATFLQDYNMTPISTNGRESVVTAATKDDTSHQQDATNGHADILSLQNLSLQDQPITEIRFIPGQQNLGATMTEKHVTFTPSKVTEAHYKIQTSDEEMQIHSSHDNDPHKTEPMVAYSEGVPLNTDGPKLVPPAFKGDVDNLSKLECNRTVDHHRIDAIKSPTQGTTRDKVSQSTGEGLQQALEAIALTLPKVMEAQSKDPQLRPIINYLKYDKLPRNNDLAKSIIRKQEDYILINDILYHVYVPIQAKSTQAVVQLVIPQDLKQLVLHGHHDVPLAGHMGINRMTSIMKARYHWAGMTRDITEYVSTCKSCNQSKPSNKNIKASLTIREPAEAPFQNLFIDTLGPLVRTPRGNKHLVVVTDQYSRFIIAWPTPDIMAKTIAGQFFHKVISVYGAPKRLMSDNGTTFTAEVFKSLCSEYGIRQVFSTAYHPQSQGSVERANRSIITYLRNYVTSRQSDWDTYISSMTFALNSAENNPLGYPSYKMLHGREPSLPLQQHTIQPLCTKHTLHDRFLDSMQSQLEMHNYASEKLKVDQSKMKQRYDALGHDVPFLIGDVVYVYQPKLKVRNTKKKLQKSFHGPFLIEDFRADVKAVILKRASDGRVLTKSISVDRLKRGHMRSDENTWDPLPDNQDTDCDELEEDEVPEDSFVQLGRYEGDNGANTNSNDTNDTQVSQDTNNMGADNGPSSIAQGESQTGGDKDGTIDLYIGGDVPSEAPQDSIPDAGAQASYTAPNNDLLPTPRTSSRRTKGQIKRSEDFVY